MSPELETARGAVGGRSEKKSDRTRRRILDATAELLSVKGFDGVRVADIAARCEMRVPGLYYYYDSREQLLAEVATIGGKLAYENVIQALAALPEGTGPLDRLCCAYVAHLEAILRDPTYVTAALRTMAQLPAEVREKQLRLQKRSGNLWRELVTAATEAGEIDPELDVHAARMFVMGALNWTPEWWNPDRGPVEEVLETARRFVHNALAVPGRPES